MALSLPLGYVVVSAGLVVLKLVEVKVVVVGVVVDVVAGWLTDKPRAWLFLNISSSSKSLVFKIELRSWWKRDLEAETGGLNLSKVLRNVSETLLLLAENKIKNKN